MNIDLNYTFKGWEQREKRKCVALDFTGTMASKGEAPAPGVGPMGMTMKVESGKLSGKTWFDPDLGHPVEIAINQDMIMLMTIPTPGMRGKTNAAQPPVSQSVTNHTKQNVVIKLVEVVSAGK
jgi:hypothetical protein